MIGMAVVRYLELKGMNENIILEENENPSSQLLNLSQGNSKVSGYIKNTKTLIGKGKKLLQKII